MKYLREQLMSLDDELHRQFCDAKTEEEAETIERHIHAVQQAYLYGTRHWFTRLVVERKILGLSQKDLAERTGLSQPTICRMEQSTNPGQFAFNDLLAYAEAVGMDLAISTERTVAG